MARGGLFQRAAVTAWLRKLINFASCTGFLLTHGVKRNDSHARSGNDAKITCISSFTSFCRLITNCQRIITTQSITHEAAVAAAAVSLLLTVKGLSLDMTNRQSYMPTITTCIACCAKALFKTYEPTLEHCFPYSLHNTTEVNRCWSIQQITNNR